MNITDIIANDKEYGDDTKFIVGKNQDGTDISVTLGDFRKDYRGKDADYRQKTGKLAEDRRRLQEQEAAQQYAFKEAEDKLAEWTKQLMGANPNLSKQEAEDEMTSDPRYKKLLDRLDKQDAVLAETKKRADELAAAQVLDQKMRLVQAHQYTLTQLKQQDADLDTEELVAFAQERGIPRLDDAYNLKYKDRITEKAVKAALDEKLPQVKEQITRELQQPHLPITRLVKPAPDAPKTLDEARDAALQDQEILSLLLGSPNR